MVRGAQDSTVLVDPQDSTTFSEFLLRALLAELTRECPRAFALAGEPSVPIGKPAAKDGEALLSQSLETE